MRIAFVVINANRFEGTSRAVLEVAERLGQHHEVDLWARTVGDVDSARVRWQRIIGPGRPEFADFGSFRWLVNRKLSRSSYDIIHSAGPNTAHADVYTIQTVHPVKMEQVALTRDQSNAGYFRRLSWRAYDSAVLRAERRDYRQKKQQKPRMYLPVSEGTKDELLASYPTCVSSPAMIRVVPNGADLKLFHPDNKTKFGASVRQSFGLTASDFLLLFTGGDWRRKGLDLLIKAMKMMPRQQIKLLVVGHDRAGDDVRSQVSALGLEDRVIFAGFRQDVERYYAAADLFVFPTSYEAFSVASIEAAASGLPVLMSQVSGANELVGDGKCGAVIERTPESIAQAVMSYFESPTLRATASRAAREKVERQFSWDAVALQTMEAYQVLLELRKNMRGHI